MPEVTKLHQGTDCNHKRGGGFSGDDADDVTFNVSVGPTCDLLERGDPIFEVLVPDNRLQSGETKVKLVSADSTDGPLHVVVPELFVPVM